jgi:hypothetical protein
VQKLEPQQCREIFELLAKQTDAFRRDLPKFTQADTPSAPKRDSGKPSPCSTLRSQLCANTRLRRSTDWPLRERSMRLAKHRSA